MTNIREFLDLANNPLFVKQYRSRMRRSAVVPGAIMVSFVCILIVWANWQAKANNGRDSDTASQMMFWFQSILLVLAGGSQVASAIAQMKESGIIDFHRITPIPPSIQTLGIMLGAPIRELILYSITLPFALYLALDGPIGVGNLAKLILVQLGSALMYYSLAMITGLTARKARGASGRFVAILGVLNLMAQTLYAFGIYGPTLITTVPVYFEVFADPPMQQAPAPVPPGAGQPNFPPAQPQPNRPEVTFYGAPLPIVAQSLMFQGGLLIFLFIGASRRIHSARLPLYTKPAALAFLATLCFLTLGSLWESPVVFLTLGSTYFLVFSAVLLTHSTTPLLGDVVKGIQRARKLSGLRVPSFSDLASNKLCLFLFACLIGVAISAGLLLAPQPLVQMGMFNGAFFPWASLGTGLLALTSFGLVLQYLSISYGARSRPLFVLYIFFAWFAPAIVGMLMSSAAIQEGGYVMAVSPMLGIAFAGGLAFNPGLDEVVIKVAAIAPNAILTIAFFLLLIGEERRLTNRVIDEHQVERNPKAQIP